MSLRARLACLGLALLFVACAVLAAVADRQLRSLSSDDANARAQLIADALASRVDRALALGIPLASVHGLDQLFDDRLARFRDVAALSLLAADGRVLLRRTANGTGAGETAATAALHDRQAVVGRIVLERNPAGDSGIFHSVALLVAVACVFAALAAEAMRYSLARGRERRQSVIDNACAALAQGDFTRRLPLLPRHDFDLRPQWLAAQLRQVRERQLRIARVVQSLRKTEPDASRRAELDEALRTATGADRFASGAMQVLPDADAGPSRSRLLGVVAGVGAWVPALMLVSFWPAAESWDALHWSAIVALSCVVALGLLWSNARWRAAAWRALAEGFILGFAFAGPGLFATAAVLAQPAVAWPFSTGGVAMEIWVALGCIRSLLAGELRRPARRVPEPAPELSRAA
jgi:hypothetical protein